jgi:hypothetical protein
MAGSREVKAGSAFVEIIAKLDPLRKSLAAGAGMLKSWGSNLSSVGSMAGGMVGGAAIAAAAATSAAVVAATKAYIDFGSAINDASARTGLGTTQLQKLAFAAGQTGASLADIEVATKTMARNGLSVSEFESLGQRIAAIPDPSQRAAAAMEAFGKSGMKLIPMFADLNSLKAQSAALGPLMSEQEVKVADELGDAIGALQEAIKRAGGAIVSVFGPEMKAALDTAIGLVVTLGEAIRDMTSFGSGGDFLDKVAELRNMSFEDFRKRGAAATGAFSANNAAAGVDDISSEEGKANKTAKTWDDIMRSIRRAHEERNRLIQGFETPAENFLRRQKEINDAMKALNNNRVLGFVGEGDAASQMAGLQSAMARLRQQEMERRAALLPKQMNAQRQEIATSSRGTFSSAAAALLGRGGQAVERKIDKTNDLLAKVEKNTARNVQPRFT